MRKIATVSLIASNCDSFGGCVRGEPSLGEGFSPKTPLQELKGAVTLRQPEKEKKRMFFTERY